MFIYFYVDIIVMNGQMKIQKDLSHVKIRNLLTKGRNVLRGTLMM